MKIYKPFPFITILPLLLSACLTPATTEYYVTPALSGQLLDKSTQQPIANVSVYLTDEFQTISNANGQFNLPPMVVSDDMNSRRDKEQLQRIYQFADVMIEGDGYQRRLFNVDGIPLPVSELDTKTPVTINIGNVYLSPLSEGEHVYDRVYQYTKTMSFCQPNESQLEVACIPVPKGKI